MRFQVRAETVAATEGVADPQRIALAFEGQRRRHLRDRMTALEAANFATVSAIAGGVLLTAGIVLFVVESDRESPKKGGKVSVSFGLGGARVRGNF